jgi:hypothetical protein
VIAEEEARAALWRAQQQARIDATVARLAALKGDDEAAERVREGFAALLPGQPIPMLGEDVAHEGRGCGC